MFTIGNLCDFFESLPRFDMNGFDLQEEVSKRLRNKSNDPIGGQLEEYYKAEVPVIFSPKIGVLLGDDLKYIVDAKSLSKTSVYIRVSCYCGYMSGDLATRSGTIPKGKFKATLQDEMTRQYKALFPEFEQALARAFSKPDTPSKNGTFICKRIRNVKPEFKVLTGYMGNLACVRLTFVLNFESVADATDQFSEKKVLTNKAFGNIFEALAKSRAEFFGVEKDDFADIAKAYYYDGDSEVKRVVERVFDEMALRRAVEYNVVHGDPDVFIQVDATRKDEIKVSFSASVGMLDLETINADDLSEPMSERDYTKYVKSDVANVFDDYVKPFERTLKSALSKLPPESGLKLTRVKSDSDYEEERAAYFVCVAWLDVLI